jgi:catechol 2,3-dioxygenase-like lactoylglutathione lyase family enzyme
MSCTQGINHLGLSVFDLDASASFFTELLGWQESGRDDSYPRTAVSDGTLRLTLWQVDKSAPVVEFSRRQNIGLHHLALEVATEAELQDLARRLVAANIQIEFMPELVGAGPRMHMMCYEPGGIRIEFIWPGN